MMCQCYSVLVCVCSSVDTVASPLNWHMLGCMFIRFASAWCWLVVSVLRVWRGWVLCSRDCTGRGCRGRRSAARACEQGGGCALLSAPLRVCTSFFSVFLVVVCGQMCSIA
jgi:hypothetical protein